MNDSMPIWPPPMPGFADHESPSYGSGRAASASGKVGNWEGQPSSHARTQHTPRCGHCQRLEREIQQLRLELQALRNENLRQEAPTLVEVARETACRIAQGETADDGYVHVSVWRIARRLHIGENTVSRHISAGVRAGLFTKRIERARQSQVDPETGEISGTSNFRTQLLVRPVGGHDLVSQLARLGNCRPVTEPRQNWGGKRLRCPDHPDALVLQRTFFECSQCGKTLKSERHVSGDSSSR